MHDARAKMWREWPSTTEKSQPMRIDGSWVNSMMDREVDLRLISGRRPRSISSVKRTAASSDRRGAVTHLVD
ncbi:hypothetical protein A9K72_31265 [Mesorhizobium loti]|nr:hypothetical protein A9174_31325 [Mesorhizobium loti NZP2037]OBP93801.1 hypothetical protein BAE38_30170 [Mesorhizobium loti]OBQ73182.1 hypothetical protein A9K72_31265 [Mesorhizobium loti]